MVICVGDPWQGPDGKVAVDREGQILPLYVGAIFFQPEETESIGGDEEGGNGAEGEEEEEEDSSVDVQCTPACYLAFSRPLADSPLVNSEVSTVRRIFLSGNVLFADEEWPTEMVNEFLKEELKALMLRTAPARAQQPQQPQQPAQPSNTPAV
jgi:hypothetical protein